MKITARSIAFLVTTHLSKCGAIARVFSLGLLLFLSACRPEPSEQIIDNGGIYTLNIPEGFPEPFIPEDNAITYDRVQLGKKLFFDPILSVDSSRSCASCHLPEYAFADTARFSRGVEDRLNTRNTPSIANVAYQEALLREGGVPTLEMQVLVPIQEHNEFDFNIVLVAERLAQQQSYIDAAHKAYEREPDPFVITRSISAFQRSLLSGNSPYDQYVYQNQPDALSADALAGMTLFNSEALACGSCHQGFNFTNGSYENNGLYTYYEDPGRYRLTSLPEDSARFKVPSLRFASLTPPYMHDGSLKTLSDVIDHYASGGLPHPNKSNLIQGFDITPEEKQQLIRFLESLVDEDFLNNPEFLPE